MKPRKFTRVFLNVASLDGLAEFYCDLLGMQNFGTSNAPLFGYHEDQCLLAFQLGASSAYQAQPNDFYWKIGLTLRNLDTAFAYLKAKEYPAQDLKQFRDIGYMAKLRDPQGFIVELLQQGFEGNEQSAEGMHPVGGQATFAHITLRVTDIAAAKAFCEGQLNMRLMSVQPVSDLGFCLYFYGWSDEALPVDDLEAVENREWLWRRPYTLLELQHLEAPDAQIHMPDAAGFGGFEWQDGEEVQHVSPCDFARPGSL